MTPGAAEMLLAGLRTALLVWGFEIVLVRVTSAPLSLGLAVEALAPWAVLATTAAMVARARGGREGGGRASALLAWAAPFALAASIVLPVAAGRGAPALVGASAVLAAVWLLAAHRTGRGARAPAPAAVLCLLLAAAASTWALDPDPPPALSLAAGGAVLWVAAALAAKRAVWLATSVALAVAVALAPERPSDISWDALGTVPDSPDILLVSMDTMRADTAEGMESYARLARAGVRFDNAQSAAPWTLPSMATALSGQPVSVHGAVAWRSGLPGLDLGGRPVPIRADLPLLAERLRQRGYDTAAVVARNPLLTSRLGFARGFAVWEHPLEQGVHPLPRGLRRSETALPTMHRLAHVAALRLGFPHVSARGSISEPHAEQVVDAALRVLRARRARPLFLWVHFMDVHLPYHHAPELSRTLRAERAHFEEHREVPRGGSAWRESGRRAYAAEAAFLDRHLARLLDAALEPGPGRGTLVALIADHGEEFLDHGGVGHGHTLYQELIRVPLVLAGAPVRDRAGAAVAEPVGLLDLAPTLLRVAGAPDASLPGQDLLGEIEPRPYVATAPGDSSGTFRGAFARREGAWKAIAIPGRPVALYDLESDPGEVHDLAASRPELAARLARASDEAASGQKLREPAELSSEEREQLRQLGYIVP